MINAWVLYRQVSAKTGASVMNLQALRIDFAKACASYDYSLHTGRPWCSDTAEEAPKTFSLFLTTRYVQTHTDGHLAFMEGQEENTQTARPQYGVHTSCHVKNIN